MSLEALHQLLIDQPLVAPFSMIATGLLPGLPAGLAAGWTPSVLAMHRGHVNCSIFLLRLGNRDVYQAAGDYDYFSNGFSF